MTSRAVVRIRRDLAETPATSTELMRAIADLLATGASSPSKPASSEANQCDTDPNCIYLGQVKQGNLVYEAYDCDGEVALYPT